MKLIIEMLTDMKFNAVGVLLLLMFLLISAATSNGANESTHSRNVKPIQRTLQFRIRCPYQPTGRQFDYWRKQLPFHTTDNCQLVVQIYDQLLPISSACLTDGGEFRFPCDAGLVLVQGGPTKPLSPLSKDATLEVSVKFLPNPEEPIEFPIRLTAWFQAETTQPPQDASALQQWWQAQATAVAGGAAIPEIKPGSDHRVASVAGVVSPEGWTSATQFDARAQAPAPLGSPGTFPALQLTLQAEMVVDEPENLDDEQAPPRPRLTLAPAHSLPTP